MKMPASQHSCRAFTLVEVLVSITIVLMLMTMLVSLTGAVQRIWSSTTGKIEQFRHAREGFETITRKLSQATLNTYWDYDSPTAPTRYMRQSELRFMGGNARNLTKSQISVTHAIFFVALLGFSIDANFQGLPNLLNTWGYFIEYDDDSKLRPSFITDTMVPYRNRFRIMEMMGPSESMPLYKYTSGNSAYAATTWFTDILERTPQPSRVVAENVLALIILPKLAPEEDPTGTKLAPTYSYDSTATKNDAAINPKNQLPPLVMVTMVAVDEPSFKNYLDRLPGGTPASDLGLDTLFTTSGDLSDSTKPGYAKDLKRLQATLASRKINYRVFTSDVSIKAAKWSRAQAN